MHTSKSGSGMHVHKGFLQLLITLIHSSGFLLPTHTHTHTPAQHPPAAGLDYKVIIFSQTIISPPFHPLTLPLLCSCGAPRSLKHNPTLLPILPSASSTTPSLAPFLPSLLMRHPQALNMRSSTRDLVPVTSHAAGVLWGHQSKTRLSHRSFRLLHKDNL